MTETNAPVRQRSAPGAQPRQHRHAQVSDAATLSQGRALLRQQAGPRRSLEMHQMSASIDSTLRLLDLADEGRFPLMSHVWRLDKWDESRERRGPGGEHERRHL